ncbi:MAG: hypothetical protein FWB76_06590 [Oscillospiraceae bacterium]|nr:hypothetical protein [Oscillospiraceae bacterium]
MIEQVPFEPLMTSETRQQFDKLWRKERRQLVLRRLPWALPLLMGIVAFAILRGDGMWISVVIPLPLTFLMAFQSREDHHASAIVPLCNINNIADIHVVLSASKGYRRTLPTIGNYHTTVAFNRWNEAPTIVSVAVKPFGGNQAKIYVSAYGMNAWGSKTKITQTYAYRIAGEIAAKLAPTPSL